jgi:hypothetical protein
VWNRSIAKTARTQECTTECTTEKMGDVSERGLGASSDNARNHGELGGFAPLRSVDQFASQLTSKRTSSMRELIDSLRKRVDSWLATVRSVVPR